MTTRDFNKKDLVKVGYTFAKIVIDDLIKQVKRESHGGLASRMIPTAQVEFLAKLSLQGLKKLK